jgi:hypothetical protein
MDAIRLSLVSIIHPEIALSTVQLTSWRANWSIFYYFRELIVSNEPGAGFQPADSSAWQAFCTPIGWRASIRGLAVRVVPVELQLCAVHQDIPSKWNRLERLYVKDIID